MDDFCEGLIDSNTSDSQHIPTQVSITASTSIPNGEHLAVVGVCGGLGVVVSVVKPTRNVRNGTV